MAITGLPPKINTGSTRTEKTKDTDGPQAEQAEVTGYSGASRLVEPGKPQTVLQPSEPQQTVVPDTRYAEARASFDAKASAMTQLLKDAGAAHHDFEVKSGVPDAAWAEWYAGWMTSQGGLKDDAGRIAQQLKDAAAGIATKEWHAPYAQFMLLKDAALAGTLDPLLRSRDVIPTPAEGWTRIGEPIEKGTLSPFGTREVVELYFSATEGLGVKRSMPVESGFGGEELQSLFHKVG